ncbi:MAG: hypothetical protein EOM61_09165 [Bacteroidia bacterium]|nr:hypothetical protein [Bacteroidia bacterium]
MRTIDGIEVEVHKLSFPFTLFAAGMGYKKVYLKDPLRASDRLVRHEMIHVAQGFKLRTYLWWWLKRGYKNSPFEWEAMEWEAEYRGWMNVNKDSWRKYI